MKFDILRHEIDALSFYQELAKNADDLEVKKEALKLHNELLKSLHELEKSWLKECIELDKTLAGNQKECELAHLNYRSAPLRQ